MKIGMNLLLRTGHVTDEHIPVLEALKQTGFDGVEVPVFDSSDVGHFAWLGGVLDDLGLGRTAVALIPDEAHSPISSNPAVRLRRRSSQPRDPLNRFECYPLNTCEQASDYLELLNEPGFGILHDTFHANIEEKDPIAAFHTASGKGHINHVHISENDRRTPGRGHAAIRETIAALKGAGYDVWLTIEAFGKALPELAAATRVWRDFFASPEEVFTAGYGYIRDCWEAA